MALFLESQEDSDYPDLPTSSRNINFFFQLKLVRSHLVEFLIRSTLVMQTRYTIKNIAFPELKINSSIQKYRAFIRHSFSPWSSPVILVKKKTGDIRLCIDFRVLNSATKKDAYPTPNIDYILDQFGVRVLNT